MGVYLISGAVVFVGVLLGWIFLGRLIFAYLDRFFLVRVAELPVTPLEMRQADFTIGSQNWVFPRDENPSFEIEMNSQNRLALKVRGGCFHFGPVLIKRMADNSGERLNFDFQSDPRDLVSMTQSHSRLSWPTPFEFSILGGSVSRWRRHMYDHLVWKKPSGQILELIWRHEEWFYKGSGWADQWNQRLVKIRVDADPLLGIAADYLKRIKGWDESCYRVEHRATCGEFETVAAVHNDDETPAHPGAGKSVILLVDPGSRKIVKEIGGQ